jgi:hypothetical protein
VETYQVEVEPAEYFEDFCCSLEAGSVVLVEGTSIGIAVDLVVIADFGKLQVADFRGTISTLPTKSSS